MKQHSFLFVGHLQTFIQIFLPLGIMMDGIRWWPGLDTIVNLIQGLFTAHVLSPGNFT